MPLLVKNQGTKPTLPPVEAFRQDLRAHRQDSCLLTPTATLAEHLRHSFAREGHFVRPDSVVTLSRFVKPLVADLPAATPALLDRTVARHLAIHPPDGFRALAESPGLRRMLAGLIEEVSTAGEVGQTSGLSSEAQAFQQVYAAVTAQVQSKGYWLRARRLEAAAARLQAAPSPWRRVYLTGFYAFTPAELAILAALGDAEVRLSLPDWEGAADSIRALIGLGYTSVQNEPRLATLHNSSLFNSSSELEEVEEIARRIVNLTAEGHPFREIGIILRSEHPYAPILRTTLRRFGIPARFYFPRTFDTHPVHRFLTGFLQALLSGWDYELLLPLLRMRYCPLAATPQGDAVEFALLARLPAKGFPGELEALAHWQAYESWRALRQTPAEWAKSLATLKSLITLPVFTDQVPQEQVLEWREQLSALTAWDEALTATAGALDPAEPLTLREFTGHLTEVCPHIPITDRDQRRNVVHVLDVYEARQWELPVVFVCGMTERSFPRYHSSHPILTDDDRLALRSHGITLRTSAERQREEAILFETATSVARKQLTLSYPRTNEKGEETLPSFFLPQSLPQKARPCRIPARWPKAALTPAAIAAGDLLTVLKKLRAKLSPTAIETYLQCPYQYFARQALKLKEPPPRPHERLDFLLQGNILHATLAETEGSPLFVEEIFTRHFTEAVRASALPHGCLTERVRLELDANLRRFLESAPLTGATTVAVENSFDLKLDEGIRIRGKIDRVAQVGGRGLVVIDYKYSRRERVRARVREHESGDLVQGGLYLWAAEKLFRQPAAGMLYCGLRGEVSWDGWHLPAFGWQDLGESADEARLREIMNTALEGSRGVAERIAKGEIHAAPADRRKCDWCEFRDTCRVETQPAPLVRVAGGSQ